MELELKIHVPDNLVIDDEQKAGQGMAEAVRDCIRRHLIDKGLHTAPNRNGLPHSGYWHKAANTVKVEVQAKEARRYVSLPLTAVIHDGEGKGYVWMVGADNKPVRRDVETGPATATYQTILSGLEEGEEVIVRGTQKIMPGVAVEPVAL